MSALGQKQTSRSDIAMSALPPQADIAERDWDVRFVPNGDITQCSKSIDCGSEGVESKFKH